MDRESAIMHLYYSIIHDGDVYHKEVWPYMERQAKFIANGSYNPDRAQKGWRRIAYGVARRLCLRSFSRTVQYEVADMIASYYHTVIMELADDIVETKP